jgi:hypothetical protein
MFRLSPSEEVSCLDANVEILRPSVQFSTPLCVQAWYVAQNSGLRANFHNDFRTFWYHKDSTIFSLQVAALQRTQAARRKARLIQVRQQDKGLAHKIRHDVLNKKEQERQCLEAHLRANWACSHQKKLKELEARYLSTVEELGRGHREAQNVEQVGGPRDRREIGV